MTKVLTLQSAPQRPPGALTLATQFGLLADPLRLQIVEALAQEQLCTCHLIEITGAKQTAISNHLRILREANVVESEAEGRFTWYRLVPGAFTEALTRLQGIDDSSRTALRLRPTCTI
jgi:ArsR family transcriptional regulator